MQHRFIAFLSDEQDERPTPCFRVILHLRWALLGGGILYRFMYVYICALAKSNGPRFGLSALKAYVHGNNKLVFLYIILLYMDGGVYIVIWQRVFRRVRFGPLFIRWRTNRQITTDTIIIPLLCIYVPIVLSFTYLRGIRHCAETAVVACSWWTSSPDSILISHLIGTSNYI